VTRWSIRTRSVVAATAAIVLALLVVGVGVDLLVSRRLHSSLDHTLRQRAVEVAQLAASAPALLTTPGALDSPLGGTQLSVEVIDRHGRIVARSLSLGGRVLAVDPQVERAIQDGTTSYGNARLDDRHLRVYVVPLADVSGAAAGGAAVVAASTRDVDDTLASLRGFLLTAGAIAAALAAVAVALLLRRALRPLGELADAAATVERTGDPTRRLPEPGTDDEVERLATTLNAMLASLERARDAERRFLADASHELRTPLTALRGNVAYLVRHGATPEIVAELAADAERLAQLADDLLALSREEAAATLDDEVRLDELARAAADGDGSVTVLAPEPVAVRGDEQALERALANLVENARRHGPDGGAISVAVERDGDIARISVSDEGRGLQPYEAERAFERFWRGHTSEPGSGLGLAIVRATAERHGGRAYAVGSRFTIELPAVREPSETAATTVGP
jgi:two-component system, OmpR family, sensor kinase